MTESTNCEIENAKIRSTMLGIEEDRRRLTFFLELDYVGGAQHAGTYTLGYLDRPASREASYSASVAELICKILEVVGVDKWESLPGKYICVKHNRNEVVAIGSLLRDKWLVFCDFFEAYRNLENLEQYKLEHKNVVTREE